MFGFGDVRFCTKYYVTDECRELDMFRIILLWFSVPYFFLLQLYMLSYAESQKKSIGNCFYECSPYFYVVSLNYEQYKATLHK